MEPIDRIGVPAHLLQGRPGDHCVLRVRLQSVAGGKTNAFRVAMKDVTVSGVAVGLMRQWLAKGGA